MRVANLALRACASSPFWSLKPLPLPLLEEVGEPEELPEEADIVAVAAGALAAGAVAVAAGVDIIDAAGADPLFMSLLPSPFWLSLPLSAGALPSSPLSLPLLLSLPLPVVVPFPVVVPLPPAAGAAPLEGTPGF